VLDESIKNQLKSTFANLTQPVVLRLNTGEGKKDAELNALAQALAELSDLIVVEQAQDADVRQPHMALQGQDEAARISFAGVPMGHEFTSLIMAILHTGGHPLKLEPEVIAQVQAIEGEFHFETYISLSCQNCPDVVQALNMLAAINPAIRHVMIDGSVFQDEVEAREVMAVPSVYLNGEVFARGRISLADIVKRIDSGAAKKEAERLSQKDPFDLLVLGGGPAGAAAAIYAARKGLRTGIATERFGGQVLDTVGIENFISVKHTEGPKLVAHLEEHVRDYDVDIMSNQLGSKVIPPTQEGGLVTVELDNGAALQSRTLVVATGARWRNMDVPGEKDYTGKGVAYCPHCDGPLFKGKKVAVIGGGNSGIEAAIDLAGIAAHVTVLEFDATLRADDVLQKKVRSLPNVEVFTQAQTTEVQGNGDKVTGLLYIDRASGEAKSLTLDGIFVQIGLIPNTGFLEGTLALSDRGEIEIDAHGQTNVPGVFAAGDATTVPYKQIVIAMGAGSTAALGALDYMIRTPLVQNTAAA